MFGDFRKYITIWKILTVNSFIISLTTRFNAVLFLTGKALRFVFFLIFLVTVLSGSGSFGGYGTQQALFFYLTFTLIDTVTQLFYREVYRFRPMIVSGDFDLVLAKPMNPLFRSLVGGADPLDLIMLVPYVFLTFAVMPRLGSLTAINVFSYLTLLLNGFLIATGFHILVLALAILTTEIDHAIMIYRDVTSMGRLPVDIYREPLRGLITFIIPVGLMMTIPAKAFMGLVTLPALSFFVILGIGFFTVCVFFWRYALTKYTSASS
ncbi:hypothetical protein A2Z33_07115 [Candidatus Gottesmanbacteria bacterium RBG_16_52_11]|uniref:ABC transporter permease n=1 Tax=Candidatus Gottesmanbacteria bacterium RBG_16_52_11 TaxID=1798374 RepID=A0A1F5YY15_9BACT|nr:MAG: hypothetical protein A2Z33_07115 [Candidatus Gottesmanbacteria bacterium RBG_16_52_11]